MMDLTSIIKSAIRKVVLGHRSDSESYLKYLRKKGATIGEGTVVFQPMQTFIDDTRPYLLEIGKNVQITKGVTILTHGYDWSVIKGVYGEILGSAGKVIIGDNVFIGMNTTILKGTKIGDNVIIGANSLINKDVPSNSVFAGNPAKQICTLEDYYHKRKQKQKIEARELLLSYIQKYRTDPSEEEFHEFFYMFHPRNTDLPTRFDETMKCAGNYEYSMKAFLDSEPEYDGFSNFLSEIKDFRNGE